MKEGLLEYTMLCLIGWASGISLYLTIALLGISGRMGWMVLPGSLEILTHPLVIGAALLMYAVEFFADKIPLVDSTWDSVHSFIRPVGAGFVAYMAGTEHGALTQVVYAVLTGAIAFDIHAMKASTRLAVNTSPEPVSNSVMSVTEDALLVAMFWFYTKHPVIASLIMILTLIGSFFVLRAFWRFAVKIFKRNKAPAGAQPS